MHSVHDLKAMARSLRQVLAERQVEINHSESLELIARQLGWRDWNTLAAQIDRAALPLPEAWTIGGSRAHNYEIGVDEGEGCALIRCRDALPKAGLSGLDSEFGSLRQSIQAGHYVGKRLRLSAQLRTQDVAGAATIWMRVNAERGRTLAFDNMETRQRSGPLTGTVSWQHRLIVLDIPPESRSIHFGFSLRGGGSVWARCFRLDEVDASVPVTDDTAPRRTAPSNLDFAAIA